jgi:4-amino-4-deoxy-L-arabinose transferase-like glycosyltransferase
MRRWPTAERIPSTRSAGSSRVDDGVSEAVLPPWLLPALLATVAVVYVLTLRPGHAWHDDFALYVLHARNLVEGIPYSATGYLYNPGNPWHSPAVYPPGFPLLLAPVYAIFGADLFALKLVVVASFVAAMGVFALLIRPLLPARYFLAAMVLVGLQPFFARFKNLLLPDYTFLLLAFASLYLLRRLYERDDASGRSLWIGVAAGVCMAGAVSVRTVGVALFAALALYQVLQLKLPRPPVVVAAITGVALVALQLMIMPSESGYAAQMADVANARETPAILTLLQMRLKEFFASTGVLWAPRDDLAVGALGPLERALMKALMVVTGLLAGSGLLIRLRRVTLLETFVLAYSAVLLYWSFISSRYMVPLFPFVLFYAVVAVRFMLDRGGARVRYGTLALGLLVSGSYAANLAQVWRSNYSSDVTNASASQLFSYLRGCSEDVRFVSERPRALALFTQREATSLGRSQLDPARFAELASIMRLDYLVTFRGSRVDSAASHMPALRSTFENRGFAVYRIPRSDGRSACPEM